MMDISDGLATDLRHILKASKVGAELDSAAIPKIGNIEQALTDGEDFELLFTAPPDAVFPTFGSRLSLHPLFFPSIGKVTENAEELLLDGAPLDGKAFEHFKG